MLRTAAHVILDQYIISILQLQKKLSKHFSRKRRKELKTINLQNLIDKRIKAREKERERRLSFSSLNVDPA